MEHLLQLGHLGHGAGCGGTVIQLADPPRPARCQTMRCSRTTIYLAGHQIRLSDITHATLNGTPVDPAALAGITRAATLTLHTQYGSTTTEVDPERLHGRRARRLAATDDPVLAALALANLAGHPERRESARHGATVAARSLRTVGDDQLAAVLAAHPEGPLAWAQLAPGHVSLRAWRSPQLAGQLTNHTDGTLGERARDTTRHRAVVNISAPDARFDAALRAGQRPRGRDWAERAALAATHPDLARGLLDDPHPLVRASAYRHAPDTALAAGLADEDPTVRRNAAAAVAERLGRPLIEEGPVRGTGTTTSSGRPQILFVDIDGTVVDGPLRIDTATVASLRAAQASGIHVVAVTGRSLDTFAALELGVDLAVCKGRILDMVTMTEIGSTGHKGQAVDTLCELLNVTRCAAAGDGAVDCDMFAAVRARGGRCAWPVSGQPAAAELATDLVGPVGSGGVGRFVDDLTHGRTRPAVAALRPDDSRRTNYPSHIVPPDVFSDLSARHHMQGDGWAAAHGHVTTAYPDRGTDPMTLPTPRPGETVEIYGVVRTGRCSAFAVAVNGRTHRDDGVPYHLTVALAPVGNGRHEKPVIAGNAVAEALAAGTIERFEAPIRIPTVAAPVGTPQSGLPAQVTAAAAAGSCDATTHHRAVRGMGADAAARHAGTTRPIQAALEDGAELRSGLVVLSGPPAAGKSTIARELVETRGAVVVNLDGIRGELSGDERHQQNLPDVIKLADARLATELALGRLVVSDATNVETRVVRGLAERARLAGVPAVAVPVSVEREEALARDRARHQAGERAVGGASSEPWDQAHTERILDRMYHRWDTSVRRLSDPEALGLDAVIPAELLLTRPKK